MFLKIIFCLSEKEKKKYIKRRSGAEVMGFFRQILGFWEGIYSGF